MKRKNIVKLTETAIMIALSVVLGMFAVFKLPFDGSVTICSMVPIAIIAYRYGVKWGFLTGVVCGLIQLILNLGISLAVGTTPTAAIAIILLDYLLAFGVYGLSGMFKKTIKNQGLSMSLGVLIASVLRYICHIITGVTVWKGFAPEGVSPWVYAITYNATFMLPETIITVVGVFILSLFLNFSTKNISPMRRAN